MDSLLFFNKEGDNLNIKNVNGKWTGDLLFHENSNDTFKTIGLYIFENVPSFEYENPGNLKLDKFQLFNEKRFNFSGSKFKSEKIISIEPANIDETFFSKWINGDDFEKKFPIGTEIIFDNPIFEFVTINKSYTVVETRKSGILIISGINNKNFNQQYGALLSNPSIYDNKTISAVNNIGIYGYLNTDYTDGLSKWSEPTFYNKIYAGRKITVLNTEKNNGVYTIDNPEIFDKVFNSYIVDYTMFTQSDIFVKVEVKTNLPLIYQGAISIEEGKLRINDIIPSILKPGTDFSISDNIYTVSNINNFIGLNTINNYRVGDQVIWNNLIYECISDYTWTATSSITPDDSTYWTNDISYIPINSDIDITYPFSNIYLTTNKLYYTQSYTQSSVVTANMFVDKYKEDFLNLGIILSIDGNNIVSELIYGEDYITVDYYKNSIDGDKLTNKKSVLQKNINVEEEVFQETNKNICENFSWDIIFTDIDEYGIKLIINGKEYAQSFIPSLNEDGLDKERSIHLTVKSWIDTWKDELSPVGIFVNSVARNNSILNNTINITTEYPNIPLLFNVLVGTTGDFIIPHSFVNFKDSSNYINININGRQYGVNVDITSGEPKISDALTEWVNLYYNELSDYGIFVESFLSNLYFNTKTQNQRLEYTVNVGKINIPGNNNFTITKNRRGLFGSMLASNELRLDSSGAYSFEENPFATGQIVAINNSIKPFNNQEYNILSLKPYNIVLSYQGPFWGTWQDPCETSPYLTVAFSTGFGATACEPKPVLQGNGGQFNNDFSDDFLTELKSNNSYISSEISTPINSPVDIIHIQRFNKVYLFGQTLGVLDSSNMNYLGNITLDNIISPIKMRYNQSNNYLYCLSTDKIYIIDPSSDQVFSIINLSDNCFSLEINTSSDSTSGDVVVTYGASVSKIDIWSKNNFTNTPTRSITTTSGAYSVTFDNSVEKDFYVTQGDDNIIRINGSNRTVIATYSISNLNTEFIEYENLNSSIVGNSDDFFAINSGVILNFNLGTFSNFFFDYNKISTQSLLSTPGNIYKLDTNTGEYEVFPFPFTGNITQNSNDGDLYVSTIDSRVVIISPDNFRIKNIQTTTSQVGKLISNSDRESLIGLVIGTNKVFEIKSIVKDVEDIIPYPPDVASFSYYGTLSSDYIKRQDVWLKTRQYIRYPRENFEGDVQIEYVWKWETDEQSDIFLYDFSGDQLPTAGPYAYIGEKPLQVISLNRLPNKNINLVSSPQHQQTIFSSIVKKIEYIDSSDNFSITPEPMQVFIGFNSNVEGPIKSTLKLYEREKIDFTITTTEDNNNIIKFDSSGFIELNVNSFDTFDNRGLKAGQIIKIFVTDTKTKSPKISMNNGLDFIIERVSIRRIDVKAIDINLYNETTLDDTTYFRTRFITQDKEIGSFDIYGQTEIEDIRYKTELSNVGQNILPEDVFIFKEYDISEQGLDWTFLNKKRKEMLINRHDIFPFVGSYKAIINAINFFGYNDLELYEYYRNININSPDFFKLFKVEIPDIFDNSVEGWKESDFVNITEPDPNFEDTNLFNLTYKITDKQGNNVLMYSLQEVIIKLQGLKHWLQKNVIPITHKILDITGRADFVGQTNIVHRNYDCKILNIKQNMSPINFYLNEAYLMPINSGSTVYVCNIDFSSENTPDFFDIRIRTYQTQKEWSPFTTYKTGDTVIYFGKLYESLIDNNRIINPRKYENVSTWNINNDYFLGDFVKYNRHIYQYIGTQSSLELYGTQSNYTPLSDIIENGSLSVWKDNTEWIENSFVPVQTLTEYRTGTHSYSFTVDTNIDPFVTIEVTSDNGYGQIYSVKKNYEIRSSKDLQSDVVVLDSIGPFTPILPIN